ncbi:hypothetical protein SGLAU_29030 [Streptomyces glaucescens]|uniref:Uncharacterized protein n=1 Tax=Streptomyces glaucescens TaxID=1907 RepID=A0A089XKL2_STRGA|nr:hypothetical protein SGLAU_29030 [Streptomyces glaucescens]
MSPLNKTLARITAELTAHAARHAHVPGRGGRGGELLGKGIEGAAERYPWCGNRQDAAGTAGIRTVSGCSGVPCAPAGPRRW